MAKLINKLNPSKSQAITSQHSVIERLKPGFSKTIIDPVTGKPIPTSKGSRSGGAGGAGGSIDPAPSSGSSGPSVSDEINDLTSTSARNDLFAAVQLSVELWCQQAKFKNIQINAIMATGTIGCLDGPPLSDLIETAAPIAAATGWAEDLANAVAQGVGDCFDAWRRNVTVPSLPWYPTFAMWPGPMAPPTPNVPTPIGMCLSNSAVKLAQSNFMKNACYGHLPAELKRNETEAMLAVLASDLSIYFNTWLATRMVKGVLGKGPIPTFNPPTVVAGPVMAGSIIEAPPHLV